MMMFHCFSCSVVELLEPSCAYVVQGMCAPLVGTTLVHMQQLFDCDIATISWTFTVSSLGYLLGAVACGFIFDRFNHELMLLVASCIEASTTIIAPFFTSLPLFIAALFIQSNSQGFIDASKVRLLSKSVMKDVSSKPGPTKNWHSQNLEFGFFGLGLGLGIGLNWDRQNWDLGLEFWLEVGSELGLELGLCLCF